MPSKGPLVSILINNFNYASFLKEAIQSALDQTYRNIEVIVVDDGSTDGSRSVIESFGRRIYPVFKPNGGQGSAYNVGFESSRGDLIHFLDSDDMLAPNAIEEAVRVWQPGVAKVQFYLKVIQGADGNPTEALVPAGTLPSGNLREEILKAGNYISPPSSGNFYSRDALLELLPMPPKDWITEADLYCIFQSPFFGEVRSIDQALGFYRVHEKNSSAKTTLTGQVLRNKLKDEARRDTLLSAFCSVRGISYAPGTVSRHIGHYKVRLASLLVDPGNHPFPQDKPLSLLVEAIRLCWTDNSLSMKQKVFFSAWLAALAIGPKRYRSRLLQLGFAPVQRPRIFQRFLKPTTARS
ncbi:MAG TPA: glycosyltransferase family A protein [Edaphobacter sp.]|nr:glycosyltransferase family A protein [Edaphobacter sp.]